ncbi:MAG: GNAT family N-acetyltransferase [Ruminococcaceae bacterium]|nr:GNAT family N-acetyltransferase [Oscillospiraceae bacterium]
MLTFIELNDATACELCHYYKNSPYWISDYSIGIKRMWSDLLHPAYTVHKNCLVVRTTMLGRTVFDYPIPLTKDADVAGVLEAIAADCRENFIPFELVNVPEEVLPVLVKTFRFCDISYRRTVSDYLYECQSLSRMAGRAYAGQRNHIRKFYAQYPGAVFRPFNSRDIPSIRTFLKRFSTSRDKNSRGSKSELERAEHMIDRVGSGCFAAGGFELDGEILSFCLAERCGDVLIDHIEKALPEFEGIYPATVQAFLQHFAGDTRYFNREDDASDRGLRMSKLQYRPIRILHKYNVKIKNELFRLRRIPQLSSERLTYDAIEESDIDSYNRLCLDDERNRYWGYDYRTDCPNPSRLYFYQDQKNDFSARVSINFAIRLHGNMIGEILLYHFNGKGSAEVGVRLLREYDGNGYAREALQTVLRFAFYTLGLDEVRAKCYHSNTSSYNLLSAVMRKTESDADFSHFIATF